MPKGPNGQKRPADAIGLAVMIGKIDELAPAPTVRGPYKKRGDENSN
jgi:hypothetical protein